ncbi:MAG: hypothetical protein WDO72_04900 [Pseudomonadota bacterium]
MRKGEPASGKEFFDLLRTDDAFCAELGRAMLAAGRLESELRQFLAANNVRTPERTTLGQLTRLLERHGLLSAMRPHLDMLGTQRNYLAHSIHALFSELIEETILERTDLLDSDVDLFTERAWQLAKNLNALANIVEEERARR